MADEPLVRVVRQLRCVIARRTTQAGSDADLLEQFVAHQDEIAFELLLWRHERMVRGVCRSVLRHEQDTEDACQATFLTLACKAGSIGKREALAGWLYKVARRIAVRAAADAARRGSHEKMAGEQRASQAPVEPLREASRLEFRAVLEEEISRLPGKYRTPIVLCYLEGKTNEEAAMHLGCPTGTVVTWLALARRRLRTRLARRGLGITAGALAAILSSRDMATGSAPAFLKATVNAALHFAADPTAGGIVSTRVTSWTRRTLRAMLMSKLKVIAGSVLILCLAGVGTGVLAYRALATDAPAEKSASEQPPVQRSSVPEPLAAKKTDNREEKDPKETRQKTEEVVTKSFKTGKSPKVVVECFNGNIEVVADAEGMVDARLTKWSQHETKEQAQDGLKNIDVAMTQERDSVFITARRLQEVKWPAQQSASAVLRVPPGAVLDLRTSNASVTTTGGTGDLSIQTSNGAIHAKESKGALRLKTSNGPIVVTGAAGPIEAETSNAPLDLQAAEAVVTAATSNSKISFSGTLAGGKHSLSTSNGPIHVTLPAEAQFKMDAETSHGKIRTDFDTGAILKQGEAHVLATIGKSPEAAIMLRTSNGPIDIRKKK
jgi:RNA polymerase sigma factor (sigma-70 family)